MAPQKGTRATLVKLAQVEEAHIFLRSLPEKSKEDLSLKEAVDKLREPLQAALAKGYSYQELATQLEKQGINISALTLKNYLPSGRRGKSQPSASTSKRAAKRSQPDSDATAITSSDSSQGHSSNEVPASEKATQRSGRGAKASTNPKLSTKRTSGQRSSATKSKSSRTS